MTINRTTLLDLPLPVTGTESGTWGDITNNGLSQYVDIAVAGMNALTSVDFTAGALTLSNSQGDSGGTNIAAGSAQYATIKVSSLAANSTITAPSSNRSYRIVNADSTYNLTIKASGQTGVTFLPGTTGLVAFNGTDYEVVGVVGAASATDNAIPKFDGTTGQIIQNTGVTIDDSNNVSGVAQLNATTADLTNIEVTNIKAKDGTSAGSIANSTGVVTLASSVLTTTDINGGTIDGTAIGGASAAAGAFTTLSASGVTTVQAGTNSAPAITTTGDTNTGIFFPAADTIAFTEGGVEAMRIDSDSNFLVGTISTNNSGVGGPAGFIFRGDSAKGSAFFCRDNNTVQYLNRLTSDGEIISIRKDGVIAGAIGSASGGMYFGSGSSGTERMRIDSNGNVGIGTTSPANYAGYANLALNGSTGGNLDLLVGGTQKGYLDSTSSGITLWSNSGAYTRFGAGGSERMRIDSSGNLLLGTTSTNGKFNLNVSVSDGVTSVLQTFSDNVNTSHFQIKRADAVVGGFWEGRLQITSAEAGGYSGTIIEMRGKDGSVWMPAVYNDSVTGRDMYISSNGQLGYLSSIRSSKTNIEDLPSIDWLYQLNPVKFQYRTKDEEGNYTETADAEIQYGLIAEDVEEINPDLVFRNGEELAGVQYSRLIAPMLKAIQELKAELDTVKAELATLKGN